MSLNKHTSIRQYALSLRNVHSNLVRAIQLYTDAPNDIHKHLVHVAIDNSGGLTPSSQDPCI